VSVLSEPTSARPVVEIDDISAATVRDFPSSNATALLITVIKELIQSDLGNESHGDNIAEYRCPVGCRGGGHASRRECG